MLKLVAQGLKNWEIGLELGICPGTVKLHLKHVFEKTGIRDRYALALSPWAVVVGVGSLGLDWSRNAS